MWWWRHSTVFGEPGKAPPIVHSTDKTTKQVVAYKILSHTKTWVLRGMAPLSSEHIDPEGTAREQDEELAASTNAPRSSSNRVGLTTRMHLDPGLIRNIIREVVETDPFDRYFIGFHLIDTRNGGIDNNQPTSTLMNTGMQVIVEDWYRRYMVPLPYHTTVDGTTIREAMQRASVQTHLREAATAAFLSQTSELPASSPPAGSTADSGGGTKSQQQQQQQTRRIPRIPHPDDGPHEDKRHVFYRPLAHPDGVPESAWICICLCYRNLCVLLLICSNF